MAELRRASFRRSRAAALMAFWFAMIASVAAAQSASSFDQGEKLLREDKPQEASVLLARATKESPSEGKSWLYLGICYLQLGRYEEAITAFRSGLTAAPQLSYILYFNMGNCYMGQGKNAFAEEMYGQAIKANPDYAPPFLQRANARMAQSNYKGAVDDYVVYLTLNPATSQAESIRKVIELIRQDEAAEAARLADEEARRIAEEQARQALLDSVAQSLRESAEDTTSLSAGSGEVQGYSEEFTLED